MKKKRFGRDRIPIDSLVNLLDAWNTYARESGDVEISGWQGLEGSNTVGESIHSSESSVRAYNEDPPRIYLSARTPGKAFELSIDCLRGVSTQIAIQMPSAQMLDDVMSALEQPIESKEVIPINPTAGGLPREASAEANHRRSEAPIAIDVCGPDDRRRPTLGKRRPPGIIAVSGAAQRS